MTKEDIISKLSDHYGEAALFALETSCVTDEDYEQGYEHVLSMILPALEEEMLMSPEEFDAAAERHG